MASSLPLHLAWRTPRRALLSACLSTLGVRSSAEASKREQEKLPQRSCLVDVLGAWSAFCTDGASEAARGLDAAFAARRARALQCWVVRGSGRACEAAGGTRCALNASERPVHAMSRQNCPDLRPRSPAPHERAIAPHAPLGTRLSALRTSQGPSGPRAPMVSMCSNGWNASSRGVTWPVFHMKISLKGL